MKYFVSFRFCVMKCVPCTEYQILDYLSGTINLLPAMTSIAERRKYIIDNITANGFVKVSDLAEELNVTPATIRKDLTILEGQGLLYRAYGSALPTSAQVMDINLNTKRLIHLNQKQRIARRAQELIGENDSIILSAGSTVAVFAEVLKPKGRLYVVTSAVNISMLLGDMINVTVMQLGGILYGNSLCVIGLEAIQSLSNVHCGKVFFGVDGVDPDHGVTCATLEEANLTHKMMEVSGTSIVLADSSKLGVKGFGRICATEDVDVLVTDSGISDQMKKSLESKGVRVIVA